MRRTFAKTVAVAGASFIAGLMVQTMAVASPVPANSAGKNSEEIITARDQIRKRDQKKDGSCQLSQDQIRKQDKKKDGSCTS